MQKERCLKVLAKKEKYNQKKYKVIRLKLLQNRVLSGENILKCKMTNTGAKYVTRYPKIKFY